MAYSQTIELVQGDQLPQLTLALRDSNAAATGKVLDPDDPATWAAIDLSGGTVRLYVREQGSSEIKDVLLGNAPAPQNGRATFIFTPLTLDTPGTFEGEIAYTDSDGRTQTVYELVRLKVRARF